MPNAQTRKYVDESELADDLLSKLDVELDMEEDEAGHPVVRGRAERSLRLRHFRAPLEYVPSERERWGNVDTSRGPLGVLALVPSRDKSSNDSGENSRMGPVGNGWALPLPKDVRYAGGYQWKGPVTIQDVLDERKGEAARQNRLVTPGIPRMLKQYEGVGQLQSDRGLGYVDYVLDCKDMSFLPNRSPFEPIFHALSSTTILDGLDLVADLTIFWTLVDDLLRPSGRRERVRIDAECVGSTVFFHRWVPGIMLGAGEAHRGWVQSYTRRVTAQDEGEWAGGTTQMVRYDLGGLGMLVRYPVATRVGDRGGATSVAVGSQHTAPVTVTTEHHLSRSREVRKLQPDRNQFVHVKVHSVAPASPQLDEVELFARLFFSQTRRCLIAPHVKGDFSHRDIGSGTTLYSTSDGQFDEGRRATRQVLPQAVELWERMVLVTRRHQGQLISFVSEAEAEGWKVWKCDQKKGRGREPLSAQAEAMLRAAKPTAFSRDSSPSGPITGYRSEVKATTIGDWAAMSASTLNAGTSTW